MGDWHLVLLDSTIRAEDGGRLDTGRLARLNRALEAMPRSLAIVCLHHQPVPVGSPSLDTMAL